MRPIIRGDVPTQDGNPVIFHNYKQARKPIIDRIGSYCSYCERPMNEAPDIEHVIPKDSHPERELDWENFLLACSNCNSIKGRREINLEEYYWPDQDNTFIVFIYQNGGVIVVNGELVGEEYAKAERTLRLTGLDRNPLNDPELKDLRWNNRRETWDIAIRQEDYLERNNSLEFKDIVIELAKARGFWSVWMTVFKDDEEMRRRLINSFPGTCSGCFDERTNPVLRPI